MRYSILNQVICLLGFSMLLLGNCQLAQDDVNLDQIQEYKCQELLLNSTSKINEKESGYSWDIDFIYQGSSKPKCICYQITLPPNQNLEKFLLEMTPRKSDLTSYKYFIMLFVTKTKIDKTKYNVSDLILNKYKKQVITSDINGFLTYQNFPKLYYLENEQDQQQRAKEVEQIYYIYLSYSTRKLKYQQEPRLYIQRANDYQLSLTLNPQDTDLCQGKLDKQNRCQCQNQNKMTQYCNVDVFQLEQSDQTHTIDPKDFRENQVFLYLNQTNLYQKVSNDTKFKLEIKLLFKSEEERVVVYDQFVAKQDFNDNLPIKRYFEEMLNDEYEYLFILNRLKSFERIIQKSDIDQLFYLHILPESSLVQLSLKEIIE